MKLGLIVAVEMEAVYKRFTNRKIIEVHNQKVEKFQIQNHTLYAIQCGPGEIAAAAATQLIISEFGVDKIFNYGVVGGLTEDISKHRMCVVDNVVHYDFNTFEADGNEVGKYDHYDSIYMPTNRTLLKQALAIVPELKPVNCASGDKFIGQPKDKQKLYQKFNTEICEMEAAGILMTCDRNQVPCLMIKMVADGLFGKAEEYYRVFSESSDKALDIMVTILKEDAR